MSYFVRVLQCKVNPSPRAYFFLGPVESEQTSENRSLWTTGRWPVTVLCNDCFQLSKYSEQDIRRVEVRIPGQGQLPPKRIWRIEVQCDQLGCEIPTQAFFQTGAEAVRENVEMSIRGKKVSCPECRRSIELNEQSCSTIVPVGHNEVSYDDPSAAEF